MPKFRVYVKSVSHFLVTADSLEDAESLVDDLSDSDVAEYVMNMDNAHHHITDIEEVT